MTEVWIRFLVAGFLLPESFLQIIRSIFSFLQRHSVVYKKNKDLLVFGWVRFSFKIVEVEILKIFFIELLRVRFFPSFSLLVASFLLQTTWSWEAHV